MLVCKIYQNFISMNCRGTTTQPSVNLHEDRQLDVLEDATISFIAHSLNQTSNNFESYQSSRVNIQLISDVPAGLSSRCFKIFCWFMRNRKTIQIIKWNLNSFVKSFNGKLVSPALKNCVKHQKIWCHESPIANFMETFVQLSYLNRHHTQIANRSSTINI